MEETKEQIVWKKEFLDYAYFDLTKFSKNIIEELAKIPEAFKKDSFIKFDSCERYGDVTCEIKIGYTRPPTNEEKAAFDKFLESQERARFDKAKSDYERLKAKFEKN